MRAIEAQSDIALPGSRGSRTVRVVAARCPSHRIGTALILGLGLATDALLAQPASASTTQAPASTTVTPSTIGAPSPALQGATQRVEIVASRPGANLLRERRESTAAVDIIGSEEIEAHGDSSLGDVMNRLPGIRWNPDAGGAPRLRGLGAGYTRVTIDGEEMPEGFDLSTLPPEQVERIEIRRTPTAEMGARAMAGGINIVMKDGGGPPGMRLRASMASDRGRPAPAASVSSSGKSEKGGAAPSTWNWSLDASSARSSEESTTTVLRNVSPTSERVDSTRHSDRERVTASGRMRWQWGEGEHLTLAPMAIVSTRSARRLQDLQYPDAPSITPWARAETDTEGAFSLGRLQATRAMRLSDDTRLEWKLGAGQWDYRTDTTRREAGGLAPLTTEDALRMAQRTTQASVKSMTSLDGDRQVTSGFEFEGLHRQETGRRDVIGNLSAASGLWLGEPASSWQAQTRRWAAYAQEERPLRARWTVQGGLRWERIETHGEAGLAHAASVWSPMLHAVWKPDAKSQDRLRIGLTHSYKPPAMSQLVGRSTLSSVNTPTQPDRSGNPQLKPERAQGIDIGFERYLSGSAGVISANIFQRHIQDVIRRVVTLDPASGRWVATPRNLDEAQVRGLELEGKVRLKSWLGQGAPALDLRADAAWYRSRVASLPGPDNRLDRQPAFQAQAGADWQPGQGAWTLGMSVRLTPGYASRTSESELSEVADERGVDAYARWRVDERSTMRLGAANLLPQATTSIDRYADASLQETRSTRSRGSTTWTVRYERRL